MIIRARDKEYEADDEAEPEVAVMADTEYQRYMLLHADDWTPVDCCDPEACENRVLQSTLFNNERWHGA